MMGDKEYYDLKVQLARIEENVSDIPEVKKDLKEMSRLAQESNSKAMQVEKDLTKLENNIQWLWRAVGGAVISALISVLLGLWRWLDELER